MLLLLFCRRSSGKAGSHVPPVWPQSRKELGQDYGSVSVEIILAILKAVLDNSLCVFAVSCAVRYSYKYRGQLIDVEKESKLIIVETCGNYGREQLSPTCAAKSRHIRFRGFAAARVQDDPSFTVIRVVVKIAVPLAAQRAATWVTERDSICFVSQAGGIILVCIATPEGVCVFGRALAMKRFSQYQRPGELQQIKFAAEARSIGCGKSGIWIQPLRVQTRPLTQS